MRIWWNSLIFFLYLPGGSNAEENWMTESRNPWGVYLHFLTMCQSFAGSVYWCELAYTVWVCPQDLDPQLLSTSSGLLPVIQIIGCNDWSQVPVLIYFGKFGDVMNLSINSSWKMLRHAPRQYLTECSFHSISRRFQANQMTQDAHKRTHSTYTVYTCLKHIRNQSLNIGSFMTWQIIIKTYIWHEGVEDIM